MRVQLLSPLFLLCVSLSAVAQHSLLERAIARGQSNTIYKFTVKWRTENMQASFSVNPSEPEGRRVTLHSPPSSDRSSDVTKEMREFESAPMEEFWCSDFLSLVGPDVELISENDRDEVLAFTPRPSPDDDQGDRRFLSQMTARLTLEKATANVRGFEMWNRRTFKPVLIAKVTTFRLSARCAQSPDKRAFVAELESKIEGSIAFKRFKEHELRYITNLELPP